MINSIANYNVLLERDWIHANWCVPSSLNQFTVLDGYEVEVVWENKQPFIATSYSIEAS